MRGQRHRVLEMLADGAYHGADEFLAAGIRRAAARVHELRQDGYSIEARRDRVTGLASYRLASAQLRLDALGLQVCPHCSVGRGLHAIDCPVVEDDLG